MFKYRPRPNTFDYLDMAVPFDGLSVGRQGTQNLLNCPTLPFWFDNWRWQRRLPRRDFRRDFRRDLQHPIQFITWNLDFQARFTSERLHTALSYLHDKVVTAYRPVIINLQEVHVTAIPVLLQHPWVRRSFQITDVKPPNPYSSYCTITLVSLSLRVDRVLRVPFDNSKMNRDVLLVDIGLPGSMHGGILRVANTHLESMPEYFPKREQQLATIAQLLRERRVVAGIVGGDLNALLPQEKFNPSLRHIGLNDAFEFERRPEQDGATWGEQNAKGFQEGCTLPMRRDKILYRGPLTYMPQQLGSVGEDTGNVLQRIGIGLKWDGRWVSDHYGLKTEIVVDDPIRENVYKRPRLIAY